MQTITLTQKEAISYLKTYLRSIFNEDFEIEIENAKIEVKLDNATSTADLKFRLRSFLLNSLKEILDKDCVKRHYKIFKEGGVPELYHYSIPPSMPLELINKYFFNEK